MSLSICPVGTGKGDRDTEECGFEEAQSRIVAPSCWEEPAEVLQMSDKDASWIPLRTTIPGTSKWDETGPTQNTLGGGGYTYPIWPGKVLRSPRKHWRMWLGRRLSRLLCSAACLHNPDISNGKWMDRHLQSQTWCVIVVKEPFWCPFRCCASSWSSYSNTELKTESELCWGRIWTSRRLLYQYSYVHCSLLICNAMITHY